MSYEYSEDLLVEQICMKIFFEDLSWDVNNAFDHKTFGEDGSPGGLWESELTDKLSFKLLKSVMNYPIV